MAFKEGAPDAVGLRRNYVTEQIAAVAPTGFMTLPAAFFVEHGADPPGTGFLRLSPNDVLSWHCAPASEVDALTADTAAVVHIGTEISRPSAIVAHATGSFTVTSSAVECLVAQASQISCNTALTARFRVDHYGVDYAIPRSKSRTLFTNDLASAAIHLTLPSATSGLDVRFAVTRAYLLEVVAFTGDTIQYLGSVASALQATTVGNTLHVAAIDGARWVALSRMGDWTVVP